MFYIHYHDISLPLSASPVESVCALFSDRNSDRFSRRIKPLRAQFIHSYNCSLRAVLFINFLKQQSIIESSEFFLSLLKGHWKAVH